MNSTKVYPDGLDHLALSAIERQVSEEIGSRFAPTTALLDGSARERRNRRVLARALAGVTAKYGVSLVEAARQHEADLRGRGAAPVAPLRSARRVVRTEAA